MFAMVIFKVTVYLLNLSAYQAIVRYRRPMPVRRKSVTQT